MPYFKETLTASFLLLTASYASAELTQFSNLSISSNAYQPNSSVGIISVAPPSIEGYSYSNSLVYPEASLGYNLRYISADNSVADVYIYPVPEFLNQQPHEFIVKKMTKASLQDIKTLQDYGKYQDLELYDLRLEVDDEQLISKTHMTLTKSGIPVTTSLYLTENNGQLFKIRVTDPNPYPDQVVPVIDSFADRMFDFLNSNSDKT